MKFATLLLLATLLAPLTAAAQAHPTLLFLTMGRCAPHRVWKTGEQHLLDELSYLETPLMVLAPVTCSDKQPIHHLTQLAASWFATVVIRLYQSDQKITAELLSFDNHRPRLERLQFPMPQSQQARSLIMLQVTEAVRSALLSSSDAPKKASEISKKESLAIAPWALGLGGGGTAALPGLKWSPMVQGQAAFFPWRTVGLRLFGNIAPLFPAIVHQGLKARFAAASWSLSLAFRPGRRRSVRPLFALGAGMTRGWTRQIGGPGRAADAVAHLVATTALLIPTGRRSHLAIEIDARWLTPRFYIHLGDFIAATGGHPMVDITLGWQFNPSVN